MKRVKRTTSTTIIFEALLRLDDFATARQLGRLTGQSMNRVHAALCHLKKHHAVQVVEADQLWWFATPQDDTRSFTVPEKAEETRQRKPRRRKPK